MAGLVDYGSSDEEDSGREDAVPNSTNTVEANAILNENSNEQTGSSVNQENPTRNTNDCHKSTAPPMSVPAGPIIGPTMPADAMALSDLLEEENGSFTPQSPYSADRALIRDLTLPSIPNYSIPPSPPGSPVASTNAKFKHFLELKKQGIHFNEKLAKSAALKNPSLMQKLMDFADIDEVAEYGTTLPKELWNPAGFPEEAFKEKLAKSQKDMQEKAKGLRISLDFVPGSENSSRGGITKLRPSTSERVMASLDKGRSSSPHIQGVKRKTRFEN
ncbi:HCNGP-like protein-domain-containing protein [Calycina marina]|uniref:HCNGP-like protein-domain-containing protein n=1 Tax=Calycina marina TaxID=1763456 RepID=A0A9P7Z7T4_9HELO|nr:HCNGP-like protein-domain-containing protein [Calycina marina]